MAWEEVAQAVTGATLTPLKPVLMEILPSLGSLFMLVKRRVQGFVRDPKPVVYPEITLIVPVYNSADTLLHCSSNVYIPTLPLPTITPTR